MTQGERVSKEELGLILDLGMALGFPRDLPDITPILKRAIRDANDVRHTGYSRGFEAGYKAGIVACTDEPEEIARLRGAIEMLAQDGVISTEKAREMQEISHEEQRMYWRKVYAEARAEETADAD